MSGFVGLVTNDGAPVDRELLASMTESLAFRGPDGQGWWAEGSVGLGHTLLRTTDESAHERQPATLDGAVWIAADARIDRREDLARELGLGPEALTGPDCHLILRAYARWGEGCVEHLIGDFAFAVWDGRERKLFCARDHFGVKPFYYARPAGAVVVSNTLNAVRLHPAVSDRLDELAVADYLLFEINQDPSTTVFTDIRRLPPAHALVWTSAGLLVRRYWSLPPDERIRYPRTRDYVEHFGMLFERAVRDRVRGSRVSILFSGGMDSTAVAAVARRAFPATAFHAFTAVYRSLIPSEEEEYAASAARHLGIPIDFLPADGAGLYEDRELYGTPEPAHEPLRSISIGLLRAAAAHAPVALSGHGGDPVFCLTRLPGRAQLSTIPLGQAAAVFAEYMIDQRRIPGFHLRGSLRALARLDRPRVPPFPAWLDRDFVARSGLEQRWTSAHQAAPAPHRRRPDAALACTGPWTAAGLEEADPGWTGTPLEERHPFFSFPLVCYMMAIPEVPLCVDKYLLRRHARGLLPEAVRRRPKSPLRADPVAARILRSADGGAGLCSCSDARLAQFVDMKTLADRVPAGEDGFEVRSRLFSFELWLQGGFKEGPRWPRNPSRRAANTTRPLCGSTATRRS